MVGLAVPSPLTTTLWLGMHGCGGRVGLRAPPGLCYRPLHDRYDRYNLSCTRYVAILVPGPRAPGPVFLFLFSPARPPTLTRLALHSPRDQKRSARGSGSASRRDAERRRRVASIVWWVQW